MTEALLDPTVLRDPQEAFLATDPSVLHAPPVLPSAPPPRDHEGAEIAAAVMVIGLLVRKHLLAQRPQVDDPGAQARAAWSHLAPAWLRLAEPAIRRAIALGRVQGLGTEELALLAGDYAEGLGNYINVTSAEAFESAMNEQLAQRWSPDLAMYRAAFAYGLDKQQMKSYLSALGHGNIGTDPIPLVARALVDRAFLARAERIGTHEEHSVTQASQVMAWIWMESNSRLPPGCRREWELGGNELHCATCLELARQVVPLREPFLFLNGAKIWAPRAHGNCYCRVRLLPPSDPITKAAPVAAGLAVLAADTGRVLMLQRAPDPKDPAGGKWEFPGGCLERGESPMDGAAREWQEEVHRRLPPGSPHGTWHHGVYDGFLYEIAREDLIPTHTRGRVTNPDDPDGDQVEAIAWWDLSHLKGNPAVRAELLAGLPAFAAAVRQSRIGKAFDERDHPRAADGEFAFKPKQKRAPYAEPPTAEPFVLPPPVSPVQPGGSAFKSSAVRPSAFKASAVAPSAFRSTKSALQPGGSAFKARPRPKNLSERIVVLLAPPARPKEPPKEETYFLPVDHFHELTLKKPLGAQYDLSKTIDFNMAHTPPPAQAGINPWVMLHTQHITAYRVGDGVSPEKIRRHWDDIVKAAQPGYRAAIDEVNGPVPIVDKLMGHDLNQIYKLAGYDVPGQGGKLEAELWVEFGDPGPEVKNHEDKLRWAIVAAVTHMDQGRDDSLAAAYADYVTWTDPARFLGVRGQGIEEAMDSAEQARISVRDLRDFPLPMEQVFAFEGGLHPGTQADSGEALITGEYAPVYHRYRSAMHDFALSPPVLRFGLRETYMVPFDELPPAAQAGD